MIAGRIAPSNAVAAGGFLPGSALPTAIASSAAWTPGIGEVYRAADQEEFTGETAVYLYYIGRLI